MLKECINCDKYVPYCKLYGYFDKGGRPRVDKVCGCENEGSRHSGCHSECSLYSEWKNAVHQKKADVLKNYAKANIGSREAKARVRRYVERKADMSKKGQAVTI